MNAAGKEIKLYKLFMLIAFGDSGVLNSNGKAKAEGE